MNIHELKEHLENGGRIRRPCWGKNAYLFLEDDELTEGGGICGGLFYSNKELLLDDWVIYGELDKVTHTGSYRTRDGRKAFISSIVPDKDFTYTLFGVIDGERRSRTWTEKGELLEGELYPEDIVAEWED